MPTRLVELRAGLRAELAPMFRLAWPVALAELGWMAMGLVDTMMVGRVSAEAIGAVSIGSHLFFAVAIFGIGMLLGLDFLVAHAFGAGRLVDARSALVHGLYLSVVLSIVLTAVLLALVPRLRDLGIEPAVARETGPYLSALIWSLLPLLLYATLRRYLQALGLVRVVMVALVSANLINLFGNWLLVFGHLGFPALGAEGSGWATAISRVYMFLVLLGYLVWYERRTGAGLVLPWRFELNRMRELVRLGLPSALQLLLEVGVFAAATVLAGNLSAVQLAAHQVALGAAAFTFMVPLGISSAAAVRVGHAMGRGDLLAAARSGWTALLMAAAFMSIAALVFLAVPGWIIRVFTNESTVLETGVALLGVAAVFQLFDGLQVVGTGALRGSGDTRTAMLANFAGHWLLGLPVGYALCFWIGTGVFGLWIGLCVGLVSVAIVLIAVWSMRTREMLADQAARDAA
jgi:MATE family multidrug resistance protein